MYSDEDLASAVKAGILNEETVAALRSHVTQLKSTPAVDEEYFRLVTGFNDIFVVIACLLLLASVSWIGAAMVPWLGSVAVSVTAWALAEFFTRKRRMALPSIVLLLAFVGGIMATGVNFQEKPGAGFIVACAIAVAAAWLHWLRFRVPITVAAGAAALVSFVVALLLAAIPEAKQALLMISFVAGVAVFLLAMFWDSQDTARQTRKSDVAFWLHLLSAPLLVHPVFAALGCSRVKPVWCRRLPLSRCT